VRSSLLIRRWRPWLFLVDKAGRLFHAATSEGRWLAFGVFILAAATVITQFWPIAHFWLIPSTFGLALFVVWAWKARATMVIEDFADHTPTGTAAVGAAALLSIELGRIHDLFRVVDERNTLPTAVGEGTPIEAAVKVDDPSEILKSSVTPETKLEVGPIAIPIGMGMIVLGRLVQGPRLRAELHERDRELVLSAQLSGLRRSPSWRIVRKLESSTASSRIAALHDMIPELACRMFTNLGVQRKVKWRAMRAFTDALEIYRRCLRTPQDRAVKLLEAQQHLVKALSEDEDFVLVYYNLGVVFSELSRIAGRAGRNTVSKRHRNKAEASFSKAVEQDPGRWEPYYALGRIQFEHDAPDAPQLARALCERVIDLLPGRRDGLVAKAKAHDLIGHTYKDVPEKAIVHRRIAARLALRALRNELATRRSDGSEEDAVPTRCDLAANCLANLAEDEARRPHGPAPDEDADAKAWERWRRRADYRRIVALLELAQRLTSKDAKLHFQLGRLAADWHDYDRALQELNTATRIDPDRVLFWAQLARVQQLRGDKEAAEAACARAVDEADIAALEAEEKTALDDVIATYETLGKTDAADRLRQQQAFAEGELYRRLRRGTEDPPPRKGKPTEEEVAVAKGELVSHLRERRRWEAAHLAFVLGRHMLLEGDPGFARRRFRSAIRHFGEPSAEVTRYNLHAYLARALTNQWLLANGAIDQTHKLQEALLEAEQAVSRNPLSSFAHAALGHVCNGAGDLEGARTAWKEALLWNPDDPWLHWELGFCNWRLAWEISKPKERREVLERARDYLEEAAILFPNEHFDDRIRIHYWLARLYEELGEFEQVIPHLRMVQRSPSMHALADYLVAEAYRRLRNFHEAEYLYKKVIETPDANSHGVEGRDVIDPWPTVALRAAARCGLAMSNIERQGDLDEATTQLGEVEKEFGDGMPAAAGCEERVDDKGPIRVREVRAYCAHANGRWLLADDKPDQAIAALRRSAKLRPDAEVYLDLAAACWARAAAVDDAERLALLERSRFYCDLVKALDLRLLFAMRLAQLLAKLDPPSEPSAPAAGPTATFPIEELVDALYKAAARTTAT
jgi:tetratricopeptide (TPR) repeat protein